MDVEVLGHDEEKVQDIVRACNGEWCFEMDEAFMTGSGEDCLHGGESPEEFALRVSKAVWAANGGFCEVYIRCYDLENIPCESYEYDEETFKEMTSES